MELSKNFLAIFGHSDEKIDQFFASGRINLIGEHIDYNGGLVMPFAISLGIKAIVRPSNRKLISIYSTNIKKRIDVQINQIPKIKPSGRWNDYVVGVLQYLVPKCDYKHGLEILISSDLPRGSGLSSSAALELLISHIARHYFSFQRIDRLKQVLLCQQVENEFVGVNCGIMDQYAIGFGEKNQVLKLDCNKIEHEKIPLETGDYTFVIINSNHPRKLAASAYNERRQECETALKIIQQKRSINNLVEAKLQDLEGLEPILYQRAKHVITEQNRVEKAAEYLKNGQLTDLGQLMFESHDSLSKDYEVTSKALDCIAEFGKNYSNCIGLRMTGAGFGGCLIGLIHKDSFDDFSIQLKKHYLEEIGIETEVYLCESSDGLYKLD